LRRKKMKRRFFETMTFVKVNAAMCVFLCLVLGVGFGPMAKQSFAKEDTVYIGIVEGLSGPYAYSGLEFVKGIEFALEEAKYRVLGKKIEVIKRDNELKPPLAVRKMREVVRKYKPFFLFQATSSSVSLAVSQQALDLKVPTWCEGFATQITGEECNRYTFRWDAPNYAGARSGLAAFLKLYPHLKTFYVIIDNNASGHDMTNIQEGLLKAMGGKFVKKAVTPLGNADFSAYLTEVASLKPDALIFNCYGSGNINLSKQIYEFGISKRMPVMSGFGGLQMLRGMPPEAPEGIHYGINWWHTTDNEWTREFVAKWKKKHGEVPNYTNADSYTTTKLVLRTAERVKSLKAKDLILGLERSGVYDGPTGKEWMRPWDHQIVHSFLVGRGKAVKDKRYKDDYLEILSCAAEFPNMTPEQSTCQFKTRDEDL
jgi:branched-chain amino acid transport system substrate-binding protein